VTSLLPNVKITSKLKNTTAPRKSDKLLQLAEMPVTARKGWLSQNA
jgi:hypothetical protein